MQGQTGLIMNGEVVLSGVAVLWALLAILVVLSILISWIKGLYESRRRSKELLNR